MQLALPEDYVHQLGSYPQGQTDVLAFAHPMAPVILPNSSEHRRDKF